MHLNLININLDYLHVQVISKQVSFEKPDLNLR